MTFLFMELIHRIKPILMRKQVYNQGGWLLVDIAIGTLILSVALTAIALAYKQSTVTGMAARNYNQATYIAEQRIEDLRKNDGKKITDSTIDWSPQSQTIPAKNGLPEFIVTTAPLTVTESIKSGYVKPYQITVSWSELGNAKQLQVASYYYLKP